MEEYNGKKIVESIPGFFKLEGDDFWYREFVGGEPMPYITVGPGPHPDPRPIGPSPSFNQEMKKHNQVVNELTDLVKKEFGEKVIDILDVRKIETIKKENEEWIKNNHYPKIDELKAKVMAQYGTKPTTDIGSIF